MGTQTRDDRVLRYTKGLSVFIAPFLVVAFVLLYLFPSHTDRLFAWTIRPTMTPMVLASAYLGGAYFFVRASRARRWTALAPGFVAVTLFASLLGVATLLHWDRFNHGHPAFWLWAGLYFTAPFLVLAAWLLNRRYAARPAPTDRLVARPARIAIAAVGAVALLQGVTMFLRPPAVIPLWPWVLTPLTCRVVGAILCLGCSGLGALGDARWQSLRMMIEVEVVMVSLILLGAARAATRHEFATDRPLTWVMLVGFVGVLAGSAALWRREQRAAPAR